MKLIKGKITLIIGLLSNGSQCHSQSLLIVIAEFFTTKALNGAKYEVIYSSSD